MSNTIYVVPVPNRSVQGRGEYSFISDNGRVINTGRQMAKGVRVPIRFHEKKGNSAYLETGLDELIENPFYQIEADDANFGDNWIEKFHSITEKQKISKQTYFEILDNVPPGTYRSERKMPEMANMAAGPDQFKNIEPSYLESFRCFLEEGVNIFNDKNSNGRLAIQAIMLSPIVAKSKAEINSDKHRFYISSKEESIEDQNRKRRKFQRTVSKLTKLLEMPFEQQYQMAIVLGAVANEDSPTAVENALSNYVWEDRRTSHGDRSERNDRFERYFKLMTDEPDRFYLHYMLEKAINLRVIDGGSRNMEYIWRSQRDNEALYKLGRNKARIVNMLHQEFMRYDPDLDEENAYAILLEELKRQHVPLR